VVLVAVVQVPQEMAKTQPEQLEELLEQVVVVLVLQEQRQQGPM